MLVAAPFIGLAFVLALPLVGLATLAWTGRHALLRNVSLRGGAKMLGIAFLPLLGLAYFLLFPIVGTASLLWVSVHSYAKAQ